MNHKPPKILFFMPDTGVSTLDGTTVDAINIARSFANSNIPAVFVFNGHPDVFEMFQQTGIDVRRIEMPVSGVKQHFNPLYRRRFSRSLTSLIEDEGIEILHLGNGGPYILNYLKKSKILKVAVQSSSTPDFEPLALFDSGIRYHPKSVLKAWYRKYVRLNYRIADLVFSTGGAQRCTMTFHGTRLC